MDKIYALDEIGGAFLTLSKLRDSHFDAWTARDRRVYLESIRAAANQANAYADELDRIFWITQLAEVEDAVHAAEIEEWNKEVDEVLTREE